MGRLIDGECRTDITNDATAEVDTEPTTFDGEIHPGGPHPPNPERYHLYVCWACPWAHGTLLTRTLLGLDDAITISVVDPYRDEDGWQFTPEKAGCTGDPITDSDYLRDVYTAADPEYTGRVSVPVLWDRDAETIVSNESADIMRTLATAFADHDDVELYPAERRDEVDAVIDELYGPINRGVYTAGFASSQSEYEAAVQDLFDALDHWENVLADRRFLLGDRVTLADLRLFVTLVRFDAVYYTHFKCNVRRIVDYPNLRGFTRDIYQLPGVADTVYVDHIKEHYYRSHDDINPTGFVPVGPDVDFEAAHDRERLPGAVPG
jgi:putative glutathione S-transferase